MNLDARVSKAEQATHMTGEPVVITVLRFDGTPPTILILNAEHLTPKAHHRLVESAKRHARHQEALERAARPPQMLPPAPEEERP